VLFVFTANPEDYTNRGSIVTPLKDRIQSQILTHYPKDIEHALEITQQEADINEQQQALVKSSDLIKRLVEQIAFEARESELVDKKSGVSARLTISAYENAVSTAERRALVNNETSTQIWVSDLMGIIPSITGKIELVYEGEQEGPYQVALNLLDKAIRTQFAVYFPNPELLKKKKVKEKEKADNPYKAILSWFDAGNSVNLMNNSKDADKIAMLYQVSGLHALVTSTFKNYTESQTALLMELVLHGLASHSLISKRIVDNKIEFKDLMGSMFTMGNEHFDEEEFNEDDF
jgi:magnesium chelatase subunit I